MTPEAFCYWLQGFAELGSPEPTPEQWEMIKEHLNTVFTKVTPPLPSIPMPAPSPWPSLPEQHPLVPNDWPPGPHIYC